MPPVSLGIFVESRVTRRYRRDVDGATIKAVIVPRITIGLWMIVTSAGRKARYSPYVEAVVECPLAVDHRKTRRL